MVLNPLPLAGTVAKGAVEYSGKQDTVKSIGEGAVDPYVAEREAYEQNREYEVRNGNIPAPIWTFPQSSKRQDGDKERQPEISVAFPCGGVESIPILPL